MYTKNTVSPSLIKHLLIVYICVIRNVNEKETAALVMYGLTSFGNIPIIPAGLPYVKVKGMAYHWYFL